MIWVNEMEGMPSQSIVERVALAGFGVLSLIPPAGRTFPAARSQTLWPVHTDNRQQ